MIRPTAARRRLLTRLLRSPLSLDDLNIGDRKCLMGLWLLGLVQRDDENPRIVWLTVTGVDVARSWEA